jgi:hypothetical protein
MAVTKVNKGTNHIAIALKADGTVSQVLARTQVVVNENGTDTTMTYAAEVDLWLQLTPQQQANLQTIVTRLAQLAALLDVALPTMPAPIAVVHPGP